MTSDSGGLDRQLMLIVDKAVRALASAERQLSDGDYDFASSRAYYAVFYVLEGALLTKSLSFSKHSGVISAFNLHFVKSGIFPKEFSGLIARLFRERQMADYVFELRISESEAQEDIEAAKTIVAAVKDFFTKQGYPFR